MRQTTLFYSASHTPSHMHDARLSHFSAKPEKEKRKPKKKAHHTSDRRK